MDVDADDTIRAIQKKETRKEKRLKAQKKEDLISPFMNSVTFEALQLSRPILKALSELGFNNPTPIQMQTIPAALKGQDICGSAVTGSGKTAAFVLPILERLLYRDTRVPVTRVLILMPTRELAVQYVHTIHLSLLVVNSKDYVRCHSVIEKMSKYLGGLTAALVTGGMQVKLQEAELAHRPDIIVATPGRVVDHLLNTKSFGLEDIEILVIDEADRYALLCAACTDAVLTFVGISLLELGFNDQLEQIVKMCPRNRQTMLFSATMTGKVEELIDMSLRQATKVSVDPMGSVAKNLTQEFIRVRNSQLEHMEGILVGS
jgi:ATP-dependent RNA helicase DDX27